MSDAGVERASVGEARCDVAIIGAGAAGLWMARRLGGAGLACIALEARALGAGQTICSQGIIHGGVKYALAGSAGDASRAIAAMPERWRACLRGEPGPGDPDLRTVRVLAEKQRLWTTRGLVSRLGGVGASKAIRTGVARVPEAERPVAFRAAPRDIDLYEVEEPVLDPASLLGALREEAERAGAAIVRVDGDSLRARANASGATIEWADGARAACAVRSSWLVLAAGAGNEELIRRVEGVKPGAPDRGRSQRRPLHMVMARGEPGALPSIYGHCVSLSTLPRATITTQTDARGRTVWHIGGGVAESGVARSREEQVAFAREEIAACAPWVDLSRVEWAAYRVDRAEGVPPGAKAGARPDGPVIQRIAERALAAWPTKLAFAPLLAEQSAHELGATRSDRAPTARDEPGRPVARAPGSFGAGGDVPVALLPWEDAGIAWT